MQESKNISECWYSTKEMCEYLGANRDTLLTWINKKNMPASKIGAVENLNPVKLMSGSKVGRLQIIKCRKYEV